MIPVVDVPAGTRVPKVGDFVALNRRTWTGPLPSADEDEDWYYFLTVHDSYRLARINSNKYFVDHPGASLVGHEEEENIFLDRFVAIGCSARETEEGKDALL